MRNRRRFATSLMATTMLLALSCSNGQEEQPPATPSGGLGQPCHPNGTCNAPNLCEEGICVAPAESQGGLGQPCYPNGTCNAPYLCESGVCVAPDPNGEMQPVDFIEDTSTDFLNPERGWIGAGSSYAQARSSGLSVIWTNAWEGSLYRLDDYRDSALPPSRLDAIDADMDLARQHGIKLKVRFFYTGNPNNTDPDASESRILQHIEQLKPILENNTDVIAMLDAGFFGRWGENHSSSHGITDWDSAGVERRANIFGALFDALPSTRTVGFRYPAHVRELFGNTPMDLEERFTGTHRSRAGWLNDCFLADRTNIGTFDYWTSEEAGDFDRATFESIGKYAAASAETCSAAGLTAYSTCGASLTEMETMSGPDLLNRDYWTGIYDRWILEGCYDEITRRLGYRLVLLSGRVPTEVVAGAPMRVELRIKNAGFGKVYNPRPMDLVLVGPGGPFTARMSQDIRRDLPLGGATLDAQWTFDAPAGLQSGQIYELHLRLPDPMESIASDNRYSIRFANEGVWDEDAGSNALGATALVP